MKILASCCALLFLTCGLFSKDVSFKQVLISPKNGGLEIELPLTDVTGSVRLKRRGEAGFGMPIAPLQTALAETDYLEWQIAYDTLNPKHPSLVPEVIFQSLDRKKTGCELTKILYEGLKLGLFTKAEFSGLQDFLRQQHGRGLEDTQQVMLLPDPKEPEAPGGFLRFVQGVPMISRSTPSGTVEIQFKQKQRAFGYQAMIYVCLPVTQLRDKEGKPFIGRAALSKERAYFQVTLESAPLFSDAVKAFGMASKDHNGDLMRITDALLK